MGRLDYKKQKLIYDLFVEEKSQKQIAKEINKNEYFSIDLNAVANLVKNNTQVLKMLSSLGIDIDEKQKELLSSMNRVVKKFIENIDSSKGNFLNVPLNIEIPDDWKNKK